MDPDDRHLVRAFRAPGPIRDLAGPSGLARLAFDELRLLPGEGLVLQTQTPGTAAPPVTGGEWFLYVRSGRGTLDTGDECADLAPGDFIGFDAAPGCALACTEAELVCLCGGGKGGYAWQRREPEQ